jgi:glyoxylase-like metal-dependent hydrolase (beta-lactamase superfamily II)
MPSTTIEPVSQAQFLAATGGKLPEPERIAEGLWSLPMPMLGDFLAYSLTIVHVGPDGVVTLVDPGWALDDAMDRLRAFLRSIHRDLSDVGTVVVTHSHPDHLGMTVDVARLSGAAIVMTEREWRTLGTGELHPFEDYGRLATWGVPEDIAAAARAQSPGSLAHVSEPGPEAILLHDGDRIPVAGADWRAVLTPGHTAGHLCIVDAERGIFFSGDHVLPNVYPGIGIGPRLDTNPVADYLDSLERIAPYDDLLVVPGHGYHFRGLNPRRTAATRHTMRRAREVAAVVAAEPDASVWEVASRLTWTAGWDQMVLLSHMMVAGLAQTEMYRELVAERRAAGRDLRDEIAG